MHVKILLTVLLVVAGLVAGNARAEQPPMSAAGAGGGTGPGHPKHIPLSGQRGMIEHGFQERALALRARRQELIAANIANADTPNYKAVDIDIQKELRQAPSVGSALNMSSTNSNHLQGRASTLVPVAPLKYVVPQQASIDGNTVDMDVERAKFSENTLMYQFSLDRVGGHYKMMNELYNSLKD
ncbi:MAG: flagellar basal body rod protein FlgB [Methylotenera sp.]|jgi:flagellar basal-body rod protein FlgB|nr:flagellar basal body rod protein FlgB [Methylotenera sp.]